MARKKQQQRRFTKVLLVEDHPMVRERLGQVLESEPDLRVCGEAEDCSEALALLQEKQPDLVILDLALKRSHGLDLLREIRARNIAVRTLVVSMHDENVLAERAIREGASGYVNKQQATNSVLEAVRAVLRGELYVSDDIRSRLTGKIAGKARAKSGFFLDSLTNRELRVFELLGQGCSTRDVAGQLGLDVRTIETYRARIKEKLRLKNGTELLQAAIRWTQSNSAGAMPALLRPAGEVDAS